MASDEEPSADQIYAMGHIVLDSYSFKIFLIMFSLLLLRVTASPLEWTRGS